MEKPVLPHKTTNLTLSMYKLFKELIYMIPKFDGNWSNSGKVMEVLTAGVNTATGVKIAKSRILMGSDCRSHNAE